MTVEDAALYCTAHNGYLMAPLSFSENKKMFELFKPKFAECLDTSNDVVAWIGVQSNGNETFFYHKDSTLLAYSQFQSSVSSDEECVAMQNDGEWVSLLQSDCQEIELCFICSFQKQPLFTLRGFCEDSKNSLNYYAETSTKGLIRYVGFQGGSVNGNDTYWKITNSEPRDGFSILQGDNLGNHSHNLYNNGLIQILNF